MNKTSSIWNTQVNKQNNNRNCISHRIAFYNINNGSNLFKRYLWNSNIYQKAKITKLNNNSNVNSNNSNSCCSMSKQGCNNRKSSFGSFRKGDNISYNSSNKTDNSRNFKNIRTNLIYMNNINSGVTKTKTRSVSIRESPGRNRSLEQDKILFKTLNFRKMLKNRSNSNTSNNTNIYKKRKSLRGCNIFSQIKKRNNNYIDNNKINLSSNNNDNSNNNNVSYNDDNKNKPSHIHSFSLPQNNNKNNNKHLFQRLLVDKENKISFYISDNNLNTELSIIKKKIKCIHDLSKTGKLGDYKKVNQDNYFIFKNFNNKHENMFIGVCDGHGLYGSEVSTFIKENLPMHLNHTIKANKINFSFQLTQPLIDLIKKVFIIENKHLLATPLIDSTLSGSTCASMIYTPSKLITANVGDSRIILGREISEDKWESISLTKDHKPILKEEANRILEKGGRIQPMKDENGSFIGPLRVYMKEEDIPGLAMTRSFGDYFASIAGTISEPEINEYLFDINDKCIVLASDGLYEFMTNSEIINIVKEFYVLNDIVTCCEYLYKEARQRWMTQELDIIDDITIIVIFLE